jgi:hypothetical protein
MAIHSKKHMAIHSKKAWAAHLLYCMRVVNVSRAKLFYAFTYECLDLLKECER